MLQPAIVSHLVTNSTILVTVDVREPLQLQDADCRTRIIVAVVLVFVSVTAKFWNYLIIRWLRGTCWLLATGFYSQFPSPALATAQIISIVNLVVRSPIFFCRLSCSCNVTWGMLYVFFKIKSISSPVIHTPFMQSNFSLNTRYSITCVASSSVCPSSVALTVIRFHAKWSLAANLLSWAWERPIGCALWWWRCLSFHYLNPHWHLDRCVA